MLAPSIDAARRRGVTLIEGVLYLIITLAVIVGGIVFFNQANMTRNILGTANAMNVLSTFSTDVASKAPSTTGPGTPPIADLTSYAIRANIVQPSMIEETGSSRRVRTPWGGSITIVEAAGTRGGNRIPVIAARLNDVPADACMRLSQKNEQNESVLGPNIIEISIEENGIVGEGTFWTPGPVRHSTGLGEATDVGALATACLGGRRDVVVYYRVDDVPDTLPIISLP